MKIGSAALLSLALATKNTSSFSFAPQSPIALVARDNSVAHQDHAFSLHKRSRLYSTMVEAPPTETEEVYGTVVGDTKGAALRLTDVAISRGASPLLKDIEWSVQPKERWGIGTCMYVCVFVIIVFASRYFMYM